MSTAIRQLHFLGKSSKKQARVITTEYCVINHYLSSCPVSGLGYIHFWCPYLFWLPGDKCLLSTKCLLQHPSTLLPISTSFCFAFCTKTGLPTIL